MIIMLSITIKTKAEGGAQILPVVHNEDRMTADTEYETLWKSRTKHVATTAKYGFTIPSNFLGKIQLNCAQSRDSSSTAAVVLEEGVPLLPSLPAGLTQFPRTHSFLWLPLFLTTRSFLKYIISALVIFFQKRPKR